MSVQRLFCIVPWMMIGGADKFSLDMLAQLQARGWDAVLATTLDVDHEWRERYQQLGVAIEEIGRFAPHEQAARLAQALLRSNAEYVLLSNSALGYAALPYLRAHAPGVTFVDASHAVDPNAASGGYPADSVAAAEWLDLQITSSQQLRSWMIAHGGDRQRIEVCTINVDTGLWDASNYDRQALRRDLGLPDDAFVGLMAARLDPVKRPALALAIMRDVTRRVPNSYFLLAGDGPYAPFVRSYIGHTGLAGRVRLLGSVSPERIRELLAVSDVLLLPSQAEGVSLAVYEAMSMGVAPVSVAAGGQAELVTPECGILIERGMNERQAYVDALCGLAGDPERLRAMRAAARHRVAGAFRLDQMGDRMNALLEYAARLHQQAPRPIVGADAARASALAAQRIAERDRNWLLAARQQSGSARRRARELYWKLVDAGAWWLVPALDRLREMRRARAQRRSL